MANDIIRPADLPARATPVASERVPSDNGVIVGGVTWADGVNAGRPIATQGEAEAGANNTKAMTPLATRQAMDARVPSLINSAIDNLNLGTAAQSAATDFATAAQGALADTAVQGPSSSTDGYIPLWDGTTGETLKGGVSTSDFATAAQGGKADTALQSIVAGTGVTVDDTDPANPVVSAGGGGGGGYDPNMALLALEVADLKGGRMGMVGGVADPFDDASGVDAVASSNYEYDELNRWFVPVVTPTTFVDVTVGTASGASDAQNYTIIDMTGSLPGGEAIYSVGVYSTTARSMAVKIVRQNSTTNFDILVSQTFSHPGTGWHDVVLSSLFSVPLSGTCRVGAYCSAGGGSSNLTAARNRSFVTGNVTGSAVAMSNNSSDGAFPLRYSYVDDYERENLTLTSVAYDAATVPSSGRVAVQTVETASITINDDVTAEISRDGGTNWSPATLALVSSLGTVKLYEDADIDLTGQPSGDDIVWRVKTDNNVDVAVSGVVAQWR